MMTERNITGTDKNSYCIYCSDMLKTHQREIKLFKFSRDTNRKELKLKSEVTLQLLHFAMSRRQFVMALW